MANLAGAVTVVLAVASCGHPSPHTQVATSPETYDGITRCGPIAPPAPSRDVKPEREPVDGTAGFPAKTAEPINDVMRTHTAIQLRSCYQSTLKRAPDSGGKVMLEFQIERDGSTSNIAVHGYDRVLDACLCEQVTTLKVTTESIVVVHYPLTFTNRQ